MLKVGRQNFDADFLGKTPELQWQYVYLQKKYVHSTNPIVPLQSIIDVRSISPRRPEFPTSLFDTGGAGNLTKHRPKHWRLFFANHRLFWDVPNSNLLVVNSYSFWFFSFPAGSITSNLSLTLQTTKHGTDGFRV